MLSFLPKRNYSKREGGFEDKMRFAAIVFGLVLSQLASARAARDVLAHGLQTSLIGTASRLD
jgi:hypothetical protein